MRTEDDLRAALAGRERLAPPADRVLAEVRRLARDRRPRRLTGAAAITAAVAVAVIAAVTVPVLLVRSAPPLGPAPASGAPSPDVSTPSPTAVPVDAYADSRPPLSFTVANTWGPVFEIRPSSVSASRQVAAILRNGEPVARLTLFRPGLASTLTHSGAAQSDEPVEVNGVPGRYRIGSDPDRSMLLWEYRPGAVASIVAEGTPLSANVLVQRDVLVDIAGAVRFTAPYPVRVPYRLDFLPADLMVTSVGENPGPAGGFSRSDVQALSVDPDRPRAMDITVFDGQPRPNAQWGGEYPEWDWVPATIAGRPARCADLVDGRRCEIDYGHLVPSTAGAFTVSMGVSDLTSDELDRIVAGMHFATVSDPATWYDANTALPRVGS